MAVPPDGPTVWQLLRPWPAWRGLEADLTELAGLLARTGDEGAGLADLTTALLDDPEYAGGTFPAEYRFRCPLARSGRTGAGVRAGGGDDDSEPDLAAWLTELARQAADTAVMLEAAGAAWQIGQALTVDLPRSWQARLAPVLLQLRQAGRRGAHRTAAPAPDDGAAGGMTQADLPATGWWQLRYVVPTPDGYSVILPQAAEPSEAAAARLELLYLILRDHGLDAARLHLTLLGSSSLSHTAVLEGLGLNRRGGGSQAARADRCLAALSRLTRLRLSLIHFAQDGQVLQYERRSVPLWEVTVQEYGQARLLERDGRLATHGAEWSLTVRPESWAPLPQLTEPGASRDDLALVLSILLRMALRAGETGPVAIPNWAVLRLAGVGAATPGLRRKLKAAARQQAALGWSCDLSGWPPETEAAGLAEAVTRFQQPAAPAY